MKLAVYIPALGQQDTLNETLRLLATNAHADWVEMHVIDNGSKEPLKSKFAKIIRNEENRGMVGSLRQAVEHSTADIIVFTHSDMYVYAKDWDQRLVSAFEEDEKLSLIGVVGATKAASNGGREDVYCSFRDWASHGKKTPPGVTPVAIVDGCFMAVRRQDLIDLRLPDEAYPSHHFYDKDLSLSLTMASRHVGVMDLDCEHLSGQTSCRPEYQEWANKAHGGDQEIYLTAERKYLQKWGPCFPVKVTSNFVVHVSNKT